MREYLDKVLCADCRSLQPYDIRTEQYMREWNGKKYQFNKRVAVCRKCGGIVTVPGLDDLNEEEFDIRCREENDYIQIEEISEILVKYDVEKRPLSKVLGLGEHTIENYLKGQLPNKKYSDMLKRVLASYLCLKKYYEANRASLNKLTAEKIENKLEFYDSINSHNSTIEAVALYILNSKYEITNMSLQKLLYYVEGFAGVLLKMRIFDSHCEAWMYGPVYPEIYEKYKSFGGNSIKVDKIDLSEDISEELRELIDYVLGLFAIYNGVTLKDLSHSEAPWINAHAGYGEKEHCREVISHEAIVEYFSDVNSQFGLNSKQGVKKYIASLNVI